MGTDGAENGGPRHASGALALAGFVVYAAAAPHSIAGSWMGLSAVALAWLWGVAATRRAGLRRGPLDLPLWLFVGWTALSSLLSYEPQESLPKLVNVGTFLMFYLARAMLTRRAAVLVAGVLVASGVAGVLWGAGELIVGRGVLVRELRADSPLRGATPLAEGDAVWRVNRRRVSSVEEVDEEIRRARAGERLRLSVISRGEHVEWEGPVVTEEVRARPSPSGITGGGPTRAFRASGWTRHYGTFAEVLQMVAQLALGFALAGLLRRGPDAPRRGLGRWRVVLPFAAFAVLGVGIGLTAMRTALVAFAVGSVVTAWRAAAGGRARWALAAVVCAALLLGAAAVCRTRAGGALALRDASAGLRFRVARVAAERSLQHPFFGHGMDAVHRHWREWGFPGDDMLHAHSTPLQLAFDRGLPALLLWLWLMYAFWRQALRAERLWRDSDDAPTHGLALGLSGALAGFLASSLVNYNFGDAEAALLLWWMMGTSVVLGEEEVSSYGLRVSS
ncbi:MAG TPA: O-antigen ligase family protein [Pyrinomonadaceae bacterium]|nr:O-antigen ligase family protein [Pyrinomonadaceae bacterium]